MRRSQSWHSTALVLLFFTLVSFACKKNPAPPPPPPPAPTVSTPPAPPAPTLPPPAITLRADNVTVTRGATVTLSWDARNASAVDIQPGIGPVTPLTTGSRQVSPASSVTYVATATGPGGPPASDTVRITVNDPPPPPPAAPRGRGNPPPPAPVVPTLTTQQLFERSMQSINFDYDKSDIRDDQKGKLQTSATFLKANPSLRFTVEGHTDERGSEEYNLALGARRANAVKQFLVSEGVPENRIDTQSFGEERPVCKDQTEECFAQNRRAAFRN